MANLQDLIIDDSGFVNIPSGSSSNRSNTPSVNGLRSNTTQNTIETFDGAFWSNFAKTIVKDRVTLWLDAANPECYPGQGSNSTVYNLAPFFYTGSFIGFGSTDGVSYDSNGWWNFGEFGGIAFGVDDISLRPAELFNQSSEITYEIWHYPESITSSRRLMSTDRSDYHSLMWNGSDLEWAVDGDPSFTSGGFTTGNWQHIVGTASATLGTSNNVRLYRNGSRVGTFSRSLRDPLGDGSSRPFAVNQNVESSVDDDAGADGRTAIVRIYGKALSDEEVLQNFEAERTRFGV